MSCLNVENSCFNVPVDHGQSSFRKIGLTALSITVLVIGVLGTAYTVCGFTSLSHTCFIFKPLSALGYGRLSIVVVCSGATGVVGFVALIILYKQSEEGVQPNKESPSFDPEVIDSFNSIKSTLKISHKKKKTEKIDQFLHSGYSNYLEYYGFYYSLACVTEHVQEKQPELTHEWEAFLTSIHQKEVPSNSSKQKATVVDCSIELSKLKGEKPSLKVEELKRENPTIKEDIQTLRNIFVYAFLDGKDRDSECIFREFYFFMGKRRPFVIRNNSSKEKEILCVVILEEREVGGKKTLFIHSLARAAHAVKLGMTEYLNQEITKIISVDQYEYVWCEVLKDNQPAQYIYEKLGFNIVGEGRENDYIMKYQPT